MVSDHRKLSVSASPVPGLLVCASTLIWVSCFLILPLSGQDHLTFEVRDPSSSQPYQESVQEQTQE